MAIYKLRFLERLEARDNKPKPLKPDDPRIGFHADANPIRSEFVPSDYGLTTLRRLAGPGPVTGLIAGDQPVDK